MTILYYISNAEIFGKNGHATVDTNVFNGKTGYLPDDGIYDSAAEALATWIDDTEEELRVREYGLTDEECRNAAEEIGRMVIDARLTLAWEHHNS